MIIDDYAYDDMDFTDDPDLMLPPGTNWGPQGENNFLQYFKYFLAFECLCNVFIGEISTDMKLLCLTQMWSHYDLHAKITMCNEEANYLLEGAMPTVSTRF